MSDTPTKQEQPKEEPSAAEEKKEEEPPAQEEPVVEKKEEQKEEQTEEQKVEEPEKQEVSPEKDEEQPPKEEQPKRKSREQKTRKEEPVEEEEEEPVTEVIEEVKFSMAEDEFYPIDHVDKIYEDSSISRRCLKFYGVQGMPSHKHYNLSLLEDNVIIFCTGNTYQIQNIETGKKQIFFGHDSNGIGSIAVLPDRKYFAVAERGQWPNIYIYSYPEIKLYRILRKNAEKSYSHIEFSNTGSYLASVANAPDFNLTVWDWRHEQVILKCKAFGQEVYRCSFSEYTDQQLITGGSGHIKFWKMAQTFTGLKLQGEGGKYGALEISDVFGYSELPDGKILSGTEQGCMILWEGNLVKAHLVLDEEKKTPLHEGCIEIIKFIDNEFMSAGADGYLKWWSLADIDAAEADETLEVALKPLREKQIFDHDLNKPACLIHMVQCDTHWLFSDANGKIWQVDRKTNDYKEILRFHSGEVSELALVPKQNAVFTCGNDGHVKLWDYLRDKEFLDEKYEGKATCMDVMPHFDANGSKVVAVGYDTGVVRVICAGDKQFTILKSFKAHEEEFDEDGKLAKQLRYVKFSPDGSMFITVTGSGELFFFEISAMSDAQRFEPLCLVQLQIDVGVKVNDCIWDKGSDKFLLACSNGFMYEYRRPKSSDIDNTVSFKVESLVHRSWRIKMMEFQMKKNQKKDEEEEEIKRRKRLRGELPKEEDDEEEDWDPESLLTAVYTEDGTGRIIVSSVGQYSGFFYLVDFAEERPIQAYPYEHAAGDCVYAVASPTYEFIAQCFNNGDINVRLIENPKKFMTFNCHDSYFGRVTKLSFNPDETQILTSGQDGLLFIHQFDRDTAKIEALFDPLEDVEGLDFMAEQDVNELKNKNMAQFFKDRPVLFEEVDVKSEGIDRAKMVEAVRVPEPTGVDIKDANIYAIQTAKLRTEEDHRLKLAEEKKKDVKMKIYGLREAFDAIKTKNTTAQEHIRVEEEDLNIDPEYFQMLEERNTEKITRTQKEVAWLIEYNTVALNKVKDKFYNCLEYEKFMVKALKESSYVTTFRVKKLSESLREAYEQFKLLLEQEVAREGQGDADEDEGLDQSAVKQEENKALKTTQKINKNNNNHGQNKQKKSMADLKREERRRQGRERKAMIERVEKMEAMHSGEDPEDRKRIDEARQSYGDYRLKLSADYIVPENLRVNFSKKRQQMILLENSIFKLKCDFNQKIAELKVRKRQIIDRVKFLNNRLKFLNEKLEEDEELFWPIIDDSVEYPEKFFEMTKEEIRLFKKQQKEAKVQKLKDEGKRVPKELLEDDPEDADHDAKDQEEEDPKGLSVLQRKNKKEFKTHLTDEMKDILKIKFGYEKEQIEIELKDKIGDFDEEITEMQKEKYRLESDIKNAETKLILFYEELILLKSMEAREQELTEKLAGCRYAKGEILSKINAISKELKAQTEKIEEMKAREDDYWQQFLQYCPETSDKHAEIKAYFEKIQRTNKARNINRDADEGEDGEDGEEDDAGGEEVDDDEDEDEEENNIASLSQEEYKIEEITSLRQLRSELADEKEHILQEIHELEKKRRNLDNQEKSIKEDLEETEEEIQDFQKEKMAKLNQLMMSIVLKVKQIQNLEKNQNAVEKYQAIRDEEIEALQKQAQDDPQLAERVEMLMQEEDWRGFKLPNDSSVSVLFTRTQILQLINRKKELDEEHQHLRVEYNEANKEFRQKKKEINENKKVRAEKEKEYQDRQMLRFGDLVDLDNLEVAGRSQAVMDLQNKYDKIDKDCIRKKESTQSDLEGTQRDLTEAIKYNTNLLNMIRNLAEREIQLKRQLDSSNKAIFTNDNADQNEKFNIQREELKQMLNVQAKEIETLKTEINLYKRKGGHIYTKVTTNRRVANLQQEDV